LASGGGAVDPKSAAARERRDRGCRPAPSGVGEGGVGARGDGVGLIKGNEADIKETVDDWIDPQLCPQGWERPADHVLWDGGHGRLECRNCGGRIARRRPPTWRSGSGGQWGRVGVYVAHTGHPDKRAATAKRPGPG
jgi:hypothetical protein